MKAVVLHEYGGPEKLKWKDVATPVARPDEVLVRVSATGMNPIDWKLRSVRVATDEDKSPFSASQSKIRAAPR